MPATDPCRESSAGLVLLTQWFGLKAPGKGQNIQPLPTPRTWVQKPEGENQTPNLMLPVAGAASRPSLEFSGIREQEWEG